MTGLHAALAALADEWETKYGIRSEAHRVFGPQKVSIEYAVRTLRTLAAQHLPVATDSTEHDPALVEKVARIIHRFDCEWHEECSGPNFSDQRLARFVLDAVATGSTTAEIEDGFGGCWPTCGPGCDLQVVRPGKVQCNHTSSTCPDALAPEPSDRAGLSEALVISHPGQCCEGYCIEGLGLHAAARDVAETLARAVADRLAVAEQTPDLTNEYGDLAVRCARERDEQRARAEAAEQEAATLRSQVAAAWALVEEWQPKGQPGVIGWFPDPHAHALRAALGNSAQVVQQIKATALEKAADAIQALHPGEVKNSVTFLRELARRVRDGGDHG
ncbi:hypothetical protein GUY44_12010 [Pimelobacter simplex]|uniref:Uncharacterized protein n=1 Tax=Nocardioides simplex TaxID=2045 RepID=A0A0A1DLA0_NOCSI|nr:hypothetical protein [Pimelobacter simplex]AIY16150.1 hypothetical protein KR76_04140 [Pimelobacter simplex]MCG8151207.1 hypothetical protein [Pimelobacter simplex]GEB17199.1 hypothetical protein NSI01_55140 [Pimelobacter simplex]SFN18885.1 hypothetical protein SAMN05421671_0023 [Pimelobacter simplex]